MKILVIGGGGREHALVWKAHQSPEVEAIFCAPGNAGIAALADCVPIEPTSIVEAAEFAAKLRIDLTIVGPGAGRRETGYSALIDILHVGASS